MKFIQSLAPFVSFAVVAFAATPAIISPPSGAVVNPGSAYDFKYQSIADYGVISYNYTLWLLNSPPSSNTGAEDNQSGHFFGRFSQPSYPGNPNPPNPPPSQLVMPDPSQMSAVSNGDDKNATFYLSVLEEYGTSGGAAARNKTSVVYNSIRYNASV